ncbi:MAG: hypothetical protein JXJ30_02370 [Halothiobacillaceae bacterium]|nr:hypothetical protein [Halothiobacillaceae bacterium]HER33970.1 hypothetical protein [Halothiobacillaceae bacterium]
MALRVDREAALGWLGIEGFRPSGRVRPARLRSPVDDEEPISDAPVEARAEARDEPQIDSHETPMDVSADVPTPAPHGADDERPRQEPVAASEAVPAQAEPADEVLTDRLCLAADSPHRVLAEAIAQVAGLACETGEGGDTVTVRGQTWELASLAGDGAAKRRLWRALIARDRRSRG